MIMIITNFKNLAKNSLRKKALLIAEAGYEAIDVAKDVNKKIILKQNRLSIGSASINGSRRKRLNFNLDDYRRVFIVGIGKGSALASATLANILGKRLTGGIALDVKKLKTQNSRLRQNFGGQAKLKTLLGTHPLPSRQNIKATQKIVKLAKSLKKDDLLISFICGGGSALACANQEELRGEILATKELAKAGANIIELNTVRKHLPGIKGGDLAKLAYPARVISLIVSDVLGNNLSMVASGPTVYDKTTKKDAIKILRKYFNIWTSVQKLVRDLTETPKDKKYFKKVKNILFLSNREPVLAMAEKAKELGLKPKIYSLKLKGEAKKTLLPLIEAMRKGEVVLAGGETTVTMNNESEIRNYGKGGRNTEAVLGAFTKLIQNSKFKIQNYALLSVASDGRDNTEAAGAIGDILTLKKAKKSGLNPQKFLNNHNSFHFFAKTGDLIYTEKRSFNVADLMLVLKI